jgi:hypothetical protein
MSHDDLINQLEHCHKTVARYVSHDDVAALAKKAADALAAQAAEIARLTGERDAAVAALERYGWHGPDCMARTGNYPCECGFDAARQPQEGKVSE